MPCEVCGLVDVQGTQNLDRQSFSSTAQAWKASLVHTMGLAESHWAATKRGTWSPTVCAITAFLAVVNVLGHYFTNCCGPGMDSYLQARL